MSQYTPISESIETHTAELNTATRRRSRPRRSLGRNSVSSAGSFQNVTETLKVKNLNKEISDTAGSIRVLKEEIRNVQQRRESRGSITNAGTEFEGLEIDDEKYFVRHSRPRTYKPIVSLVFAFICAVMFFVSIGVNGGQVEDASINPLFGPSVDTLLALGAKDTQLLQDGEVYRLVTPIFLHVGILHLLINLLGLFLVAVPMEQEFGNWRILTIMMTSGIAGIIVSALFAPQNVGVGASGAIFGLLGGAWADLIQNWHIYHGKNVAMFFQYLFVTLLNFFFGLMPFVDNFAHLGGFVVGLAVGSVLLVKHYGNIKPRRGVQITCRVFSVLVLPILIAVLMFLLFLGFDVAENCLACSYISCVPFPPGADDKWWECSPCFNGFGDFRNFSVDSVSIDCPNGDSFEIEPFETDESDFEANFAATCSAECE